MGRSKVINGLKGAQQKSENNSKFYQEPMGIIKNWGNMMRRGSYCKDTGSRILNELKQKTRKEENYNYNYQYMK